VVVRTRYESAVYSATDTVCLSVHLLVSVFIGTSVCQSLHSSRFIGIWYQTLVTPLKKFPGHTNTRTGLGGFSNRVGVFAYALTPFTVLLGTRESLLSLATGIPYQNFNFLHRWTGRIIFAQATLHTVGWTIVEARLYRTPHNFRNTLSQQYIIFGVVAQFFITFLYIFSTSWAIRWTGYEFFKKSHILISILYIGACWGHWDMLWCWCVASLALIVLDIGARWLRTLLLASGYGKNRSLFTLKAATATIEHIGDIQDSCIRVDFDFEHSAWQPGQHFFLCFPGQSIWQSHPFTPCSVPVPGSKMQHHTYLIRTHSGITGKLARLAQSNGGRCEISVVITGPYGSSSIEHTPHNSLFVAGGTGVTSVLPTLLHEHTAGHVIDFVWIVREAQDLLWLAPELARLKDTLDKEDQAGTRVRIFVTREAGHSEFSRQETHSSGASIISSSSITRDPNDEKHNISATVRSTVDTSDTPSLQSLLHPSANFEITFLDGAHPSIADIVAEFAERAALNEKSVRVMGAGPVAMGTELRAEVAVRNRPGEVVRGREAGSWELEVVNRE